MKIHTFWVRQEHLTPQLQPGVDKEGEKKLRTLRKEILGLLLENRFVSFEKQPKLFFDNKLNCIWLLHGFQAPPDDMFKHVSRLRVHTFHHWEMPTVEDLKSICQEPLFEKHEKFQNSPILSGIQSEDKGFQTVHMGTGDVDVSQETLPIIPIHKVSQRDIFSFIVSHSLLPKGVGTIKNKLSQLYKLTISLNNQQKDPPLPSLPALKQHLLEGDYVRARLPVLEEAYLHDMGKGLWELHQPKKPIGKEWREVSLTEPWESRDPERDIQNGVVALDFGTSSTVVACRKHGKTTLLRVGITDFFRKPLPEDYQNPTILEFIHLPNLLTAWTSEAYRPLTKWDDVHFSHEALASYRENEADQRIVAGILTNIKQWPLIEKAIQQPLRITDQSTGTDMEIHTVPASIPPQGERISVSSNDPFDPIELYAYYLGLFINNRSNGLFLEYYMTFPVTYPKEIKTRIRASFTRGLMRSLPPSLVESPSMQRFFVREEASEPAAYAACALSELNVIPNKQGSAFAVFDFGGGSTDFDFGIFRLPTPEEEEQGYEQVIHHFGASGDIYLGGENLVAHLAFLTFFNNLELCREHHIPFACPPEGDPFPGHELFIDNSHVAQTNSALLMAKVRPLWEAFQWNLPEEKTIDPTEETNNDTPKPSQRRQSDYFGDVLGQAILDIDLNLDPEIQSFQEPDNLFSIELELLNRNREKVSVTFTVDRNQINRFLVQRVGKGIYRFFIAMQQAFSGQETLPEEVHILQAGNASRAMLVQALFSALLQHKMEQWKPPLGGLKKNTALEEVQKAIIFPKFIVHRPPIGDPLNPYQPTAKTGVAIGLLKLIPGETLLAISPAQSNLKGEAPFHLYVGHLKSGRFQPVLQQNTPYGEWHLLGTPTRRAFILIHSKSPQAGLGKLLRGTTELRETHLEFGEKTEGKRVYIQAVGPTTIHLCLADSLEQLNKQENETIEKRVIDLI